MRQDEMDLGMVKVLALSVVGAVVALVVLITALGSWYTIDQTERGVLLRNGAFVEVVQPGLRFKMPWVESVKKVDVKTHTYTYGRNQQTGRSEMEAYSRDGQPAFLRMSVTARIDPSHVADLYSRFGGDLDAAVSRLIAPQVFAQTKIVFGGYTAARAISERGALNIATGDAIRKSVSYDPLFIVDTVQIEDISFSGEYIKSIEQRMQAEVEVQRLQQNLAREKVQAEIAVTQANGQADSKIAVAKAEAQAIELRGTAEAKAIEARAKALGQNPFLVELTRSERWDGKLPASMIPGTAVPFLNVTTHDK